MASAPDQPPESIVLGAFSGIKNTVAPERLVQGELEAAVNVDIDDTGQVRRRRGYDLKLAGDCHSLYHANGRHLVVKDGELGTLGTDYTFTSLTLVGADPLSYVTIGETTYFTSRSVSGKLSGDVVSPWGQTGGAGEWLSPVIAPTDTLGAVAGKLLGPPPLASIIEAYKGRIYLANDRWIWVTELYLYDKVDRTQNVLPIEHEVTLMMAMDDGIYVGTTGGLYFLSGTFASGLKLAQVSSAAVLRGSGVWVPAAQVHPQARQGSVPDGVAATFLTTEGICAAFDGGQVFNLTQGRAVFPGAVSAAALYREDQGVSQYIAVTDSAGGPSSTARIGDYVDAEIRRFQGG